jgi:hypothetical protein
VYRILEVEMTELIIKLEPGTYKKYKWCNQKVKPMIYAQFKKALYGTLQAALLFGNCYPAHYRSGVSVSMSMIDVW